MNATLTACYIVTVLLLWGLLALTHAGPPPLRMEVSPRVSTEPLRSLHIKCLIQPSDENRSFTVSAAGEDFYRATSEELDGAAAPLAHDIWWERTLIPCGSYEVRADVYASSGRSVASARKDVYVCGVPE